MFNIHVRSIFRIFVPVNAPSNVTTVPFAQENQFGFRLEYQDPAQSCQYNIQLFNVDDLCFVAPGCFSLAKRKIHYPQPSTERKNSIDGIFIRIKINHGFFDFRKSGMGGRINVRLDVSCYNSAGELMHSGSSPIFLLYPKRRQARVGDDEDSACLFISWENTNVNSSILIPTVNESLRPDQHASAEPLNYSFSNLPEEYNNSFIIPLEEVHNSIESSHEQYSENDSYEIGDLDHAMKLYNELVPQTLSDQQGTSSDQYMVLYDGNAEVVGNFRALNFYKASDIRIKEDIRKLIDDYDCRDILMQIDGVAYRFKQGVASSVNKRFVGFIAQQVESVVPDAVQLIDGILHVDYEALLPFLNESIKKNYRDISNIRSQNQQIQQSIDILYAEFVKREAIVKYQHHPSSMFSDHVIPPKVKPSTTNNRRRTPFLQWILLILAGAALFISGAVAVYFMTDQNPSPNSGPMTPAAGPPVPKILDRDTDKRALQELYMATGGAKWKNSYGWMTELDMCSWYGIQCLTARVTRIILSENGLTGTIPSSIGYLDQLGLLILAQNDISGTMPACLFSSMPRLVSLNLSDNPRLGGTIPTDVDPPMLRSLYIAGCNLTGTVPKWFSGSKLQDLALNNNRLTGTLPVLPILSRAYLQSNQFEGSVPQFIGYVGNINLANNRLTGTLDNWRALRTDMIILANNSCTGHFPMTSSQSKSITTLDISNNQFTSIRPDLVPPTQLNTCNASNNAFKCPIPQWLVTKCGATCK